MQACRASVAIVGLGCKAPGNFASKYGVGFRERHLSNTVILKVRCWPLSFLRSQQTLEF